MIIEDEYLNYMTIITSINKILNIAAHKKYKVSQDMGELSEFVQNTIEIGKLPQDFVLL